MEQEIQDIISKQLPAQVGEVLRKRLEQAEQDAQAVVKYRNTSESYRRECDEYRQKIEVLKLQLEKHVALEARELAVEAQERNIELVLAQNRAKEAERLADSIFRLTETVFRNPVYKETVSKNLVVPGGNNCSGFTQIVTDYKTNEVE